MRIRELKDGVGELDSEEVVEASGAGGRGGEAAVVPVKVKRVLVGAGARVLFYPTLVYNLLRNRFEEEFRWWDRVDQYVLLGAVPFPSDVPCLRELGVRGVVTLNEPYETLVSSSTYQEHGINHLVIPTRDYLFAPSPEDISRAVDFIHSHASHGRTTYVHCKAGRGRSTTIVLCYLVKHRSMTPESALDRVRSIRPRVRLAPSQWRAVKAYSRRSTECISMEGLNPACSQKADQVLITEEVVEGYFTDVCDDEDLPLCQYVPPEPNSPASCSDAVFITAADLEGYETYVDTRKDFAISVEVVVQRKPITRILSCLFGASKLPGSCKPAPSQIAEVRAC